MPVFIWVYRLTFTDLIDQSRTCCAKTQSSSGVGEGDMRAAVCTTRHCISVLTGAYPSIQRIRGFFLNVMRYINPRFTYFTLLTY